MIDMNVSPLTLVIALASRYVTSWLRGSKWFGVIDENSKGKVHIVNGAVALVLTTAVLFFTGSLQEADVKSLMDVLFNAVMAFSGGTAMYEIEKSSK
jgi:hypothetical protein